MRKKFEKDEDEASAFSEVNDIRRVSACYKGTNKTQLNTQISYTRYPIALYNRIADFLSSTDNISIRQNNCVFENETSTQMREYAALKD